MLTQKYKLASLAGLEYFGDDVFMKLYLIHIGNIVKWPPVINLITMLEHLQIETIVITTKSDFFSNTNYKYITVNFLPIDYEKERSLVKKLIDLIHLRRRIWAIVDDLYTDDDLIWITSDITLKHVGMKICERNYILQMMELTEYISYHHMLPFKLDAHKIGIKAKVVVVPEYNRAQIMKLWWNLTELPMLLKNKPYVEEIFHKNMPIVNETASRIIKKLDGKKIILYQGIIHKERPLDNFIYAVERLGDEYAFVVMAPGIDPYRGKSLKNYYFIPGIAPPAHLQVTSHAYIGVLAYVPVPTRYSILNALYCAPNKTYEYGMFGLPMIGNNIPGLHNVIATHNCGVIVNTLSVQEIIDAIKKIETEYGSMSAKSKEYYEGTDMMSDLRHILMVAKGKLKAKV